MDGDKEQTQRVCEGIMLNSAVLDTTVDGKPCFQLLPRNARISIIIGHGFASDVSQGDLIDARLAYEEAMIEQRTFEQPVNLDQIQDEMNMIADAVARIQEKVGDVHSQRIDMMTDKLNVRIVRRK